MFLMHNGAGIAAVKRSAALGLLWGIVTAALHYAAYSSGTQEDQPQLRALLYLVVWEAMMIVFYTAVIVLPLSLFFRRPALYPFAAFWLLFRCTTVAAIVMQYYELEAGDCLYIFSSWMLFGLLKPFVVYYTLLRDSLYWQGAFVPSRSSKSTLSFPYMSSSQKEREVSLSPGNHHKAGDPMAQNATFWRDRGSSYDITEPLLGQKLEAPSAREVAVGMDLLQNVPIINFAYISLGQNYTILGAGGTSRVYKGKLKGAPVAVKMIYCMSLTPRVISNFYEEANFLAALKHPNIVELLGICVLPPSLCLVMELAECSLFHFIHRKFNDAVHSALRVMWAELTINEKLRVATECARGIAHLHTREPPILHMDIKSLNFLITRNLHVKVCDFEWSRALPQNAAVLADASIAGSSPVVHAAQPSVRARSSSGAPAPSSPVVGSPLANSPNAAGQSALADPDADLLPESKRNSISSNPDPEDVDRVRGVRRARRIRIPDALNWAAPEVARYGVLDEKSECYSLGVVIWEIFTGREPFDEPQFKQGRQMAVRAALLRDEPYHPPITPEIPVAVGHLLQSCWQVNPENRPTSTEIVTALIHISSTIP